MYFFRGESLGGVVDVLCYRDYTREGKRVNTHSLIIQGVQLPTKTQGDVKYILVVTYCLARFVVRAKVCHS